MSTGTYPLDLVDIEIETPSEGAFVVGLSQVGDALSPADASMEWFSVSCEATTLDINRGGKVDGPSTSIEVGTMSLTYVDGPDPAQDIRVRPGVRCRARTADVGTSDSWGFETGDGTPTFSVSGDSTPSHGTSGSLVRTGSLSGLVNMNGIDTTYGSTAVYSWVQGGLVVGARYRISFWFNPFDSATTVSCTFEDAVYGVDIEYREKTASSGWTLYETEFTAPSESVTMQINLSAVGGGSAQWVFFDDFAVERLFSVLYTGTVEDVETTYDEDHVYSRLSAVDSVRTLNSTPRYGASSDWGWGHESWRLRAARLLTSCPVPSSSPATDPYSYNLHIPGASSWSVFGTVPAGQSASTVYVGDGGYFRLEAPTVSAGTTVTYNAYGYGIECTLSYLTPGMRYFMVWPLWLQTTYPVANPSTSSDPVGHLFYAIAVDGVWGEPFKVTTAVDNLSGIRFPTTAFVAESTSVTLKLARAFSGQVTDRGSASFFPEAVHAYGPCVFGYAAANSPVIDTPHETSLANHLQILADSVGAAWWVNRNDAVIIDESYGGHDSGWHFSDDASDHGTEGHVCIVEAEVSYNTQHACSVVRVENFGAKRERQGAPDLVDSRTVFVESGNYLYGRREGQITTTLPVGHIDNRAAELFTDPAVTVGSVTFDALAFPDVAASDIGESVTVTARGVTAAYYVVGIHHSFTPDRWLCQFTLRPEEI